MSGPGPQPVRHRFRPQDQTARIISSYVLFLWAPTVMGHRPMLWVSRTPAVLNFWVGSGVLGLIQPQLRTGFLCEVVNWVCRAFLQRQTLPAWDLVCLLPSCF